MKGGRLSAAQIQKMLVVRVAAAAAVLGAVFFVPAGTLNYWQAWVYIVLIVLPGYFVGRYLAWHDPALIARRSRLQEREVTQRRLVAFSLVAFAALFLLPGLDRRFVWSAVPVWAVLAADVVLMLGYLLVFLVYRENTYAARVVEVEKGQRVISTGPYGKIRHPMYAGTILMLLSTPLALGSYWALIPALMFVPIIAARAVNEEGLLSRDLPGYAEYRQKVRFRLVPGIW